MAALTTDVVRVGFVVPQSYPNEALTQLTTTTIYQGGVAMLVAGKARPYVAATAGSTMLGVAFKRYTAVGGDKTYTADDPMVFKRGVFEFGALAGDVPTQLLIGKTVAFADDNTIKATTAANDLTGILRRIRGSVFEVEI